jgi:hypothetical protein
LQNSIYILNLFQAEIAARKLVKIRRGAKLISEDSATTAVNNAHFTIGQALPTFNQAGSNQPKPSGYRPVSFLGADSKPPAEAKVSLFENNNNGLFNNNNNTHSAPESKSLFANNNNTSNGGSLF